MLDRSNVVLSHVIVDGNQPSASWGGGMARVFLAEELTLGTPGGHARSDVYGNAGRSSSFRR